MTRDVNKGRLLGAHCSISGGIEKAPERGGELQCSAIQLFTKNSNQWKAAPLSMKEIDAFKEVLKNSGIRIAFAHTGYLVNLATVDPTVHENSMESMRMEIERAEALELPYVIVHPGSHKEAGELVGILQAVENLIRLKDEAKGGRVQIVMETTAGQGSSIGYNFDHFAEILDRLDWPPDIGVCFDTGHVFQAGYDFSTKGGYREVMRQFDEIIGLDYIRVFHLNDSKTDCGSKVDRHEHIGKGKIGREAFEFLLGDKRFEKVPMVIETPKGASFEEDLRNLNLLRSMIR